MLRIPGSIILIHFVCITIVLFFMRISIKLFYQVVLGAFVVKNRVLIYGADELGVVVKKVIDSDTKNTYSIRCFLDNNKNLTGKKLNGIPVFQTKVFSLHFLQKKQIQTLIFAMKNITAEEKSRIFNIANEASITILETPPAVSYTHLTLPTKRIV